MVDDEDEVPSVSRWWDLLVRVVRELDRRRQEEDMELGYLDLGGEG